MRKAIILILAMVVALSALPVTFAGYKGGWKNWDRFWQPSTTVVYSCPTYCNVIFDYDSIYAYDNEDTFTEPKEVGQTTAEITNCGKNLDITITNAYPGYEGTIDFCVKNIGIYQATVTGITTVPPNPVYYQIGLTGDVQPGTTLQPLDIKCGQLVIDGIPQREDAQGLDLEFTITIDFDCIPVECETAYAYYSDDPELAQCFLDLGYTKWGWTNGPFSSGHYVFDIYAGAAQCDLSKGENVGTLTVDSDGSTVTVTYDITGSGYRMTETHLYIGTTPIPPNNKPGVPGQYPYSDDDATLVTDTIVSYEIPLDGDGIYIIAHAVVCR